MTGIKIGIIGGSGMDDPKLLKNKKEKKVTTPFGSPSSPLTTGKINGTDVVILARHGKESDGSKPHCQLPGLTPLPQGVSVTSSR